MCGIIAAFNTEGKAVNDFIINQYENQYSRGEEGFGIIRINEKGKVHLDRACEPTKFMMDLYTKKSKMIIAHHRFPTSTDNLIDQTHPMSISNPILDYDYLIIHNGVVRNDDELREKHLKLGFEYQTEYREVYGYSVNPTYTTKFNDSEAIAIELALFIEGKSAAIETEGSAALIAL
jgi:glucosamine 6-phosphate synthetase-like amidotransferase/phosphosugar isomerase protein